MPTVFGIDQFSADIAADLTARGITVTTTPPGSPSAVLLMIGEWNTESFDDSMPSVVIGHGDFQVEEPAGDSMGATGWIDMGDGTVARALLHRAQTFTIWVHSIAPDNTDPSLVAQAARQATDALLDQVLAAIRRTRGGRVHAWGTGKPIGEPRGSFVYGSIRVVNVVIPIPVFDDPTPTAEIGEVEVDEQMTVNGVDMPPSPETTDTTG